METRIAVKLLALQMEYIEYLKKISRNNIKFKIWKQRTTEVLESLLGKEHRLVLNFKAIQYKPMYLWGEKIEKDKTKNIYLQGLDNAKNIINEIIKEINSNENYREISKIISDESKFKFSMSDSHIEYFIDIKKLDLIELINKKIIDEELKNKIIKEIEEIYLNLESSDKKDNRLRIKRINMLIGNAKCNSVVAGILYAFIAIIELMQ